MLVAAGCAPGTASPRPGRARPGSLPRLPRGLRVLSLPALPGPWTRAGGGGCGGSPEPRCWGSVRRPLGSLEGQRALPLPDPLS